MNGLYYDAIGIEALRISSRNSESARIRIVYSSIQRGAYTKVIEINLIQSTTIRNASTISNPLKLLIKWSYNYPDDKLKTGVAYIKNVKPF